jgi:hypothetical protein
VVRKVGNAFTSDLLHDLLQLTFEHDDGVIAATGTEGADTIHEGTSHEGELGSTGKGASDVRSAADATIDHEGGAGAEFFGERGKWFDGGLAGVELTAAVI